jgi:hypothetical protein
MRGAIGMNINDIECPKFAWILMVGLGCLDIFRGFMHTVLLEYAATNIFVIDTSGGIENQIFLLGLFGITNYLTGIMLILIGLTARHLVPIIIPILPLTYIAGSRLISNVAEPTAQLGGIPFMNLYLVICLIAFIGIVVINIGKRMNN